MPELLIHREIDLLFVVVDYTFCIFDLSHCESPYRIPTLRQVMYFLQFMVYSEEPAEGLLWLHFKQLSKAFPNFREEIFVACRDEIVDIYN